MNPTRDALASTARNPQTGNSRNKENNGMKYLKMLGLAAVAAMALTALLGAGSASAATFLCKAELKEEKCAEHYPSGTAISASLVTGTTARLTTNIGTVTCKKSTVGGKTTSTEAHGEITSLTFTECTDPFGNPCTVKAVNTPYTASAATAVAGTPTGNGTMTISTKSAGPPGATVECGSWMNCKFTNSPIVLDVIGGAPAKIIASKETLNREGGFCPSESFWDAEYTVTAPNPLYIY
jgi:hypothetical protein